jgi:hypothetical protein
MKNSEQSKLVINFVKEKQPEYCIKELQKKLKEITTAFNAFPTNEDCLSTFLDDHRNLEHLNPELARELFFLKKNNGKRRKEILNKFREIIENKISLLEFLVLEGMVNEEKTEPQLETLPSFRSGTPADTPPRPGAEIIATDTYGVILDAIPCDVPSLPIATVVTENDSPKPS